MMKKRLNGNSQSFQTKQTRNKKSTVAFMYVPKYPHTKAHCKNNKALQMLVLKRKSNSRTLIDLSVMFESSHEIQYGFFIVVE